MMTPKKKRGGDAEEEPEGPPTLSLPFPFFTTNALFTVT